eukprot:m.47189 g.47189  ORF g.47189 m.47189 type:complete len:318 (-) comp10462_c0_seq1:89-1042(-)
MEPPAQLCDKVAKHGFELKRFLGSGAFSEVWRASWKEKAEQDVACKVYTGKFTNLTKEQLLDVAETDYGISRKLKHPNILETYGLFKDSNVTCLALELVALGDLLNSVKPNIGLQPEDGRVVVTDICAGLEYMHKEHKLAHLDIKAENILLAPGLVAKLADFDAAMPIGQVVPQVRGTQDIHPPEYLIPSTTGYTISPSADVWAVGYIAFLCLYGRYIWDNASENDSRYQAFLLQSNESFPASAPESLLSCFTQVFDGDANNRPSMGELKQVYANNWIEWTASKNSKSKQTRPKVKIMSRMSKIFGKGKSKGASSRH